MEEPNIDKNVLGKLIQYYRTQKKISRYDVATNNDSISFSTLKRLENGDECKIIQYEKACLSLKINFTDAIEPYNEINHLLKSVLNILNSGKPVADYLKIKDELFDYNNKYKDYIYLNDLSLLGINVLTLYMDVKIFNHDNLRTCDFFLVNCDNNVIKILASYLLSVYAMLFLRLEREYKNYLSYYKNIKDLKIIEFQKPNFDLFYMNIFEIYSKHNENYLKNNISKSREYFISCYSYACVCIFTNKPKKAIEVLNNLICITKNTNSIPLIAITACHHRLAYAYFYAHDFDKAYENFMFVYDVNPDLLETSYCFLFKILEFKNDIYQIINIVNKNIDSSFGLAKLILEYYKLKHINKAQDKDLCKFIIKNFKYTNIKSKICFDFFEKEIYVIADKSKLYKQYFEFIGGMHENQHFKLAIDDSSFI